MKRLLYKLFTSPQAILRVMVCFAYDANQYASYADLRSTGSTKANLKALLAKQAHGLEKGLALPKPRMGFGLDKVRAVCSNLEKFERLYGNDPVVPIAKSALAAWVNFHEEHPWGSSEEKQLDVLARQLISTLPDNPPLGGIKTKSRADVMSSIDSGGVQSVLSRSSLRQYSEQAVTEDELIAAIDVAKSAPSVCNRQGFRVHATVDNRKIEEWLSYQSGNRGFGSTARGLVVVTVDQEIFSGAKERNQAFVDGGLFSMMLMQGLHFQGIGSCPLNWCVPPSRDAKFRKIANIPASEAIIMMLSVGHMPEKFDAAVSMRPDSAEFLKLH